MAAEPEPTEPLTLALLVGGGAGVGKTSVLRRFLENRFNPASAPTAGVEFLSAPLPPLGSGAHPARLVVCDPSHAELDGAWPERLRGAASYGVLLVVELSRPETLEAADRWLLRARKVLRFAPGDEHALLLAHKHDSARGGGQREAISPHALYAYCAERGLMGWAHTTAQRGRSVHGAIERLLEAMALAALHAASLHAASLHAASLHAASDAPAAGDGGEGGEGGDGEPTEQLDAVAPVPAARVRAVDELPAAAAERPDSPLSRVEAAAREASAICCAADAHRSPEQRPQPRDGAADEPLLDPDQAAWEWEECVRLLRLHDELPAAAAAAGAGS